jgi:branched-chain amino acid transport system ATP-binding protein
MLTLDNIHTYYGRSHILQGVSLNVDKGETVALLGRNGVGKTTTMKTIMGFTPARDGRVLLQNVDITRKPAHEIARAGVGLVPQGRDIFPTLTTRENITLAARHTNTGGWTLERVLATFPALGQRLDHKGGKLSGGEQQMVAIGRALMTNPSLLLLDEPSEGLAPLLVAEIGRVIGRLRDEGLSILVVEQNLGMALELADRLYVMNKGQIVFTGTPADLRSQPEMMHQYLGV